MREPDDARTLQKHAGREASALREPREDGNGYVIGVDLGGTNLRLALADMSGNITAKWSSSTVGMREPEKVIDLILDGVKYILPVSATPLRSVAIGVPGITDVENGIVLATSYLMGWKNVPLRALIEEKLGVPAIVDNDVNLAAIGENAAGAAVGVRDFVFLAIGTGIGAGIFLNGMLYRGSGWAAGELGYMLVPGTIEVAPRPNCPGALENMIGGEGIKAQWQQQWRSEQTLLPKELNATEIFDYALIGDSAAHTILSRSATMLAQTIYNVCLILNCPLVVLGGSVGMHPALCNATRQILNQWNMQGAPRLATSSLGQGAQLQGAVSAALELVSERG